MAKLEAKRQAALLEAADTILNSDRKTKQAFYKSPVIVGEEHDEFDAADDMNGMTERHPETERKLIIDGRATAAKTEKKEVGENSPVEAHFEPAMNADFVTAEKAAQDRLAILEDSFDSALSSQASNISHRFEATQKTPEEIIKQGISMTE